MRRQPRNREPEVVVDLREPVAIGEWGAPLPCPECSGRGYLDHIDPFRETMHLHCTRCASKYEITRAEVEGVVS